MYKLPGITGKRHKWLKDGLDQPFHIRKDALKLLHLGILTDEKANGKKYNQLSFTALLRLLTVFLKNSFFCFLLL